MKNINKTTIIIAFSTLALGLILGWLFFGGSNKTNTDKHNHAAMAESEMIWTCSMHPQVRRNESGDCPLCGMDLIPLETTDNDLDPMAVSMSPAAMQLAQVQTMVVGENNAEKSIRLNGKVQTDERLLFTQSSHISGRVEKLAVNFTGDFVSEGQVIAYIYSPDLVTAQEELFEAKKIKETQPELFNAAKEKLKNWKLTDRQIEEIVASNKTIEVFPILANVSGYVTKKLVHLGDYLEQGEAIYEIADLSKVWLLFDVYESDMIWIKKGASINYTIQSLPGKEFNGIVSYIDPVIDPKTRVAKARIETTNRSFLLKPEMFVTGTIKSNINRKSNSITVPKTAVMWTGKRSVVYVMQKSEQGVSFMMRETTLGPELGESYVIESGLEAGEEIAINGTFSIDAAAQLAGKPSMMNPEGSIVMTSHNHAGSPNEPIENTPIVSKKLLVPEATKKALLPLFNNYFNLKTALVNDDFEKAKEAGKVMNISLGKIDMNLFEGEAHSLWMEQSASLKKNTKHIEHLKDIKAIRENFLGISNAMIAIAESFDPVPNTIYIQHCPMANSDKGADWLSKDKKVLNPYFGATMLTCGENKKTIN